MTAGRGQRPEVVGRLTVDGQIQAGDLVLLAAAAAAWCQSRFSPPYFPPPPYRMPLFATGFMPSVEKKPISRVPVQPPTKCTPTTSSESS